MKITKTIEALWNDTFVGKFTDRLISKQLDETNDGGKNMVSENGMPVKFPLLS